MNVDQLRKALSERNVDLWVEGKMLRFRAPEGALNEPLLAAMKRCKKDLIESLERESSPSRGQDELQPLSIGQQALYFLHSVAPHSPAYNVASVARICSPVNVEAMRQTMQDLTSRHDSLRTTFVMRDGQPCRRIQARVTPDFCQVTTENLNEEQLKEEVHREYRKPFDLANGPLLRVRLFTTNDKNHVFLMTLHHLVFDSWSLWLLHDEFRLLYEQHLGGKTALLPTLRAGYSDFVRQQQEMERDERGQRLWSYWKNQLAGDLSPPDLPLDFPRPEHPNLRGATHRFRIPAELSSRLRSLATSHGVTPFVLMLAIFKTLIHRSTGQEDVIVGTATSGRTTTDFARVIGYFVNTLAIRTNATGKPTFSEYLGQVKQRTLEALEHQEFPFPLLVDRLNPRRDSGRLPICTVLFGLQKPQQFQEVVRLFDEDTGHIDWGGLDVHPFELNQQEGQFDLTLEMFETTDSFLCTLKYDVDLFRPETAEQIGRHFVQLAEAIVENPNRSLDDYEMTPEDERRRIASFGSALAPAALDDPRAHRLFELQTELTPHRVAAIADGESLTYSQLNRRANRMAHILRRYGVVPGTLVACRLDRGMDVAVVILAIFKAGGTYVPLDGASPEDRLRQVIRESGAQLVVAHEHLKFTSPPDEADTATTAPKWLLLDDAFDASTDEGDENLDLGFPASTLAYVIYTSGSTGVPKGVCVSHRAFAEHVVSVREAFGLNENDRVLQFSNLTFDPSLEQLLAPWSLGATVVIRGNELWAPDAFWDFVDDHRLSMVNLPPAYFKQCHEALSPDSRQGGSLRLVIVGGDVFPIETLTHWKERNVRVLNAYGPTEAVITASVYDATHHDPSVLRVPIGRPIPGMKAYVLDDRGRHAPIGIPGELYLGGTMLADGYLNDEELTAKKFVADPFSNVPGAKMYRTGDRARWSAEGNIEFLGRTDRQIKIHGFRVETGEIENALRSCPNVREAFVRPFADSNGDTYLVAWLAGNGSQLPSSDDLRRLLRKKLPSYMVPRQIVSLDRLPVNAAGKIDVSALPEPAAMRPQTCDYVAPRTENERILVEVWSNVLNVERIGIHDSFFDLGGGSLTSLRIVAQATDAGLTVNGQPIRPEMLFEYSTVGELAALVDARTAVGAT